MAETDLPLWLVRGHEEKARRDAALAASEAERLAARVRLLYWRLFLTVFSALPGWDHNLPEMHRESSCICLPAILWNSI